MTQNHNVSVSMNQAAAVKTGMVFKQGDFGFNLVITVLDFDVTGTTPQIVFRKPMGAVESSTITVSGNTYTYAMKGTELDTPGKVFCDLKLKNSTTQRISTASFMFEVVADTLDGLAEESSSYSDTIAQLLDNYIQKSSTAGLVKNDGTIDTNSYALNGNLITLSSEVTNIGNNVDDLLSGHMQRELTSPINTYTKSIEYDFAKDREYKYTNNTNGIVSLILYHKDNTTKTISSGITSGQSVIFVCDDSDYYKFASYFEVAGTCIMESNDTGVFSYAKANNQVLESQIDKTNSDINASLQTYKTEGFYFAGASSEIPIDNVKYTANWYGFATVLTYDGKIKAIETSVVCGAACTLVCDIYDHNVYGTLLRTATASYTSANEQQKVRFIFDSELDASQYTDIQVAVSVSNNTTGMSYSDLRGNVNSIVSSGTGNFNRYKASNGWVNLDASTHYQFMLSFVILEYGESIESSRIQQIESKLNVLDKSSLIQMNYMYVSNDYTSSDEGYGTTKFNTIRSASNYISGVLQDNSYNNRYTIIVKKGTYTDMQTEFAGVPGTYYQGVICRDYVYYESEDILHPEDCIIEWDGKTGFDSPVLSDVYNKAPFHIIGSTDNGIHTHIKGFTFNCKNLRYAFHTETQAAGIGANWEISNCILNWGGRPDIASDAANSPVIGMGTSPFEIGCIKDCVLNNTQEGNTAGIQDHTNPFSSNYGYTPFLMKGANISVENCKFNESDLEFRTGHTIYETPNVLTVKGCSEINHAYFGLLNGVTVQSWKADIACSDIANDEMSE